MKNKFGVILGLLTLALMLVTAAYARDDMQELTGRVTAVDSSAGTFTVETTSGSVVLKTTPQTVFAQQDDKTTRLTDLRIGDRLRVKYQGESDARTATHVTIIAARSYQSPSATAAYGGQLPGTASPLPIFGLSALLMLSVAFALRAFRHYSS